MSGIGGEKGQSLIVLMFGLAALLGMISLAVDMGSYLQERRALQTAVDAAALAGAADLPAASQLAVSRAQDWATRNGVGSGDILSVNVTTTYEANDTISVSVTREVRSFFARVLGGDSLEAAASAAARVGSPAGMDRFVPLAAMDATLSGLSPGDSVTLKYDSQTQTNGNTLALAFPGSSGGADFRDSIYYGGVETFCVLGQEYPGCTSTISTEPGAMVGPTQQGLNDLLQGTATTCDTFSEVFYPDPYNTDRMLIAPECNPFPPYNVTGSKRLALVPVIDSLCNGRCDVHIIRFAMVFLNDIQCTGGAATCERLVQ